MIKCVNQVLDYEDSGGGEIKKDSECVWGHLLISPALIVHYALSTKLGTKRYPNLLCSRF